MGTSNKDEVSGDDVKAVKQRIDELARLLEARDAKATAALYAPDATTFAQAPPLAQQLTQEERVKSFQAWFDTWKTPVKTREHRDLHIDVAGDLAMANGLVHMTGTKRDGTEADIWFRETLGFRKIDGNWLVTHQHESVPFNMKTFAAELGLQPGDKHAPQTVK